MSFSCWLIIVYTAGGGKGKPKRRPQTKTSIIRAVQFLTAIDLIGEKASALDQWAHHLNCPWCGEEAWAVADYFQCHNEACPTQTASAEDYLALHLGGHEQAAQFVTQKCQTPLDLAAARRRMRERAVLDMWLGFCQSPPTTEATGMINRLESKGFGIKHSAYNAVVLDGVQMKQLVEVAKETGAEYPDQWDAQPPSDGRAFCVQTRPYTIDRILIMDRRGRTSEVVWNRYTAGFCSLIGLSPRKPKLVTANIETALWAQHEMAAVGAHEEVSCVFTDLYRGEACPRWEVQTHLLTAVTRHVAHQSDPDMFGPEDLIQFQQTFDQFPGLERTVKGLPIDWVVEMRPREAAVKWSSLRVGLISSLIPTRVTQMPASAASLLERTGTKSEDVTKMIGRLRRLGRHQLADDISLLALTKEIHRDMKSVVKETANDYRRITGADTTIIANFSLKISSNVTFLNQNAERYCQATLRCGQAVTDVLFPQAYLHDQIKTLEAEMQRQLAVAGEEGKAGLSPTIIEVNEFRKKVIPHLRSEAGKAPPVHGVDRLGWSDSRKSFTFPGFVVGLDGLHPTGTILCPSIPTLKKFKAIHPSQWAEECPRGLDQSCHDIVAMIVASSVRYFRRCVTKPIHIAQSSDALTVTDKITEAFGQQEVYELNHNVRDHIKVEGVYGYPLLAAGPRQAGFAVSQIPYLHLTDQGYKMPTSPDPKQAAAAARAAQYCLQKVVEWCLSTGGDEFREIPAIAYHRSLLREGKWLIENVCQQEAWEISEQEPSALEDLLSQIPFSETKRRLTLVNGTELNIDIRDLKRDTDGILQETRDLGSLAAIDNNILIAPAVRLLPAISDYYGTDPDMTVIAT